MKNLPTKIPDPITPHNIMEGLIIRIIVCLLRQRRFDYLNVSTVKFVLGVYTGLSILAVLFLSYL